MANIANTPEIFKPVFLRGQQILDAALKLAAAGKPVFPLNAKKKPTLKGGFYNATTDSAAIRELWRRHAGPLIGVPTGRISGINILDVDTARHDEAKAWWEQNRHRIPPTRQHDTRSGSFHLLFQHNDLVRCSAGKLCLGVDTRASGGYLVWWPAVGCDVVDLPIAKWPDWLLAEFKPKPHPLLTSSRPPTSCSDGWLRGLVRFVATAAEGQRNQKLFWAACRCGEAVRAGKSDENFVVEVLIEAARRAGLSQMEAQRTIQSGMHRP